MSHTTESKVPFHETSCTYYQHRLYLEGHALSLFRWWFPPLHPHTLSLSPFSLSFTIMTAGVHATDGEASLDSSKRKQRRGLRLFKGRIKRHGEDPPDDDPNGAPVHSSSSPQNLIVVTKTQNHHSAQSSTKDHPHYYSAPHQGRGQLKKSSSSRGVFSSFGRSITKTKAFREMCDKVFDSIDTDGSGTVDEKELYSGLLLIHLKLGMYIGSPACARPLDRERCRQMMQQMDTDGSGELNRDEFRRVMVLLFSNVLLRVMILWTATIVLVPLLAKYILEGIFLVVSLIQRALTQMETIPSPLVAWPRHAIALSVTYVVSLIKWMTSFVVSALLPHPFLVIGTKFGQFIVFLVSKVPSSVWATIPPTLISTIISVVAVPWVLLNVDEFFAKLASRKSQKYKKA